MMILITAYDPILIFIRDSWCVMKSHSNQFICYSLIFVLILILIVEILCDLIYDSNQSAYFPCLYLDLILDLINFEIAIPANSVILEGQSGSSFTLFTIVLFVVLDFCVLGQITLHVYLGGQLKAKCPFFLQFMHVVLDIQEGIEGGRFCFLPKQSSSV